jgi:hypothetical protein
MVGNMYVCTHGPVIEELVRKSFKVLLAMLVGVTRMPRHLTSSTLSCCPACYNLLVPFHPDFLVEAQKDGLKLNIYGGDALSGRYAALHPCSTVILTVKCGTTAMHMSDIWSFHDVLP